MLFLHNNSKGFLYCLFLIILTAILIGCNSEKSFRIINPYEKVDWNNDGRFKANFHTHTTLSDGYMNPQTVVDEYHKRGYSILAITDHNQVTYPWTEFSKMEPPGRYKVLGQNRLKSGQIKFEDLVYENRNFQELGMVSIPGNELTHHNHMISLFSKYDAGEDSHSGTGREEVSLKATSVDNGLAFWAHPMGDLQRQKISQLIDDTIGWYVDLYNRYDHLMGQEINNRRDDYILWDSLLTRMMPDKPVWGFSNDDMHTLSGLGSKWNELVLPELSEEWVRRGIIEGRFFFTSAPDETSPPMIDSISVNQKNGTIHIYAADYKSIEWISGGKVVYKDNPINIIELPDVNRYVRAVLYGKNGTYIGTQPFGINLLSSTDNLVSDPLYSKGGGVTDFDGNKYETIIIGDQEWMGENLKVTHYSDGSAIENGSDNSEWANNKSGAYAWYSNDEENFKHVYGALYNWYAVSNEAGLPPDGWRIPTDEDWKKLEIYLGMDAEEANSGGYRGKDNNIAFKLMSDRKFPDEHPRWDNLLFGGTNTSGFSASPGGYRSSSWATYGNLGRTGYWWTATEYNPKSVWIRKIQHNFPDITRYALGKNHGFSVRCVKDK